MNLDAVKNEVSKLLNQQVMLKISGSRGKSEMIKGYVTDVYPNIFIINVENRSRSFTYSDVAIGDVKIYHM